MEQSLQSIANELIASQSFDFPSFAEAKTELNFSIDGVSHQICYDRLSLHFYRYDLSIRDFFTLGKLLELWLQEHSNEDRKKREEYGILLRYTLCFPELAEAKIQKREQPDFVLTYPNEKTIGIEVTRFIRAMDNIVNQILRKYSDSKLSLPEIDRLIKKEHGQKASNIKVKRFVGNALWCYDQSGFLLSNKPFIETANKKLKKYHEIANDFDDFILLCDATQGINITTNWNADDLMQEIETLDSYSRNIRVVILYQGENNQLCALTK